MSQAVLLPLSLAEVHCTTCFDVQFSDLKKWLERWKVVIKGLDLGNFLELLPF